jgi:glycerol uptake facilitator protein
VLCGILVSNLCGSADAHLNPAITLAMAAQTGDYSKIVPYISAQILGAFVGAALVWLFYLPHWKITEDSRSQAGDFLHHSGDTELSGQFSLRGDCDICAGDRGWCD